MNAEQFQVSIKKHQDAIQQFHRQLAMIRAAKQQPQSNWTPEQLDQNEAQLLQNINNIQQNLTKLLNAQAALSQQKQKTFAPTTPPAKYPGVLGMMNNTGLKVQMPATVAEDVDDDRLVTKRKIQELVEQMDSNERLEPEVEDILLDIADEFIESVTTFGCRLAKHRKSNVLEVKDLQLHLERNWNVRIPGFASDEIRSVRKTNVPASHQAKVQAVNSARQADAKSQKKES
ncbi:hypothetical protein BZG36_02588 [Bifiguratus adelaidae]|uniref:TBP-associated factor 12 n=1 Tax=Bifiguratus adelaidae TaxID=1938954 RepID=A0A261Y0Z1_9FUNG|nr:hypothetical protein BZG36_02588 [Bifiguratus adelaidae]